MKQVLKMNQIINPIQQFSHTDKSIEALQMEKKNLRFQSS